MKTTFMILIVTTVSPGDHQRHVEAQHEGEGNPTVKVSKVDADLLKVLLHLEIITAMYVCVIMHSIEN